MDFAGRAWTFSLFFSPDMASIHRRKKSPFWCASFRTPDGRWLKKSTGTTDRKVALKMALAWEEASLRAKARRLTAASARRVLAELVAVSSGEPLAEFTVNSWFERWLADKEKEGGAAASTLEKYKQVSKDFLSSMGDRASTPLEGVTPDDIQKYRDDLHSGGRAVSSVNQTVRKVLSAPFSEARRRGLIVANPVMAVKPLKDRAGEFNSGREPFSPDEVAALIATAKGSEWEGAIILGATGGLRLGDIANLSWSNVDLGKKCLSLITQKTRTKIHLPLHPDFLNWVSRQSKRRNGNSVFPSLAGAYTGGRKGLSAQFKKIMVQARITSKATHREGAGRTSFSKSFHSLRHAFISGLAAAGVAVDVRKALAGHADEKIHQLYTHHSSDTLKSAVQSLPSIFLKPSKNETNKKNNKTRISKKPRS